MLVHALLLVLVQVQVTGSLQGWVMALMLMQEQSELRSRCCASTT